MTSIEWTDRTWNPVRGCTRVSPGCVNCYAERLAVRFSGTGRPYEGLAKSTKSGPRWTNEVRFVPEKLTEPLRWKKPQRIFVNSMSDLFHESLSDEAIAAVFAVMAVAPQHTFQILTKRPLRMREWFSQSGQLENCLEMVARAASDHFNIIWDSRGMNPHLYPSNAQPLPGQDRRVLLEWPLPNVWLGVSVEDQQRANERIPLLLDCPAAVRFLSVEPLLEPVDLTDIELPIDPHGDSWNCLSGDVNLPAPRIGKTVDWVIVGGESGPGARMCDQSWIEDIVVACGANKVPVFVKQLGSKPRMIFWNRKIEDPKGADPSEWPSHLQIQEFPR